MRRIIACLYAVMLLTACSVGQVESIWVEAENFTNKGGWNVDQQFTFEMGSPYLIAHGMGRAVEDASTEVEFPSAGTYHVYVRCYNWTSPWSDKEGAGRFAISVGEKRLSDRLGATGNNWEWQYAGEVDVAKGKQLNLTITNLLCGANKSPKVTLEL